MVLDWFLMVNQILKPRSISFDCCIHDANGIALGAELADCLCMRCIGCRVTADCLGGLSILLHLSLEPHFGSLSGRFVVRGLFDTEHAPEDEACELRRTLSENS